MKKFKLLKELPWIPKWSIFTSLGRNTYTLEQEKFTTTAQSHMLFLARENDRVEEIVEKKDTAYNGMYFWDTSSDTIVSTVENWFKDSCKLHNWVQKLKAMKAVWKRHAGNDGDFVPDWEDWRKHNEDKRHLDYDYHNWAWLLLRHKYHRSNYFLPYFSSEEKAQQCIEDLGETLDDLLL